MEQQLIDAAISFTTNNLVRLGPLSPAQVDTVAALIRSGAEIEALSFSALPDSPQTVHLGEAIRGSYCATSSLVLEPRDGGCICNPSVARMFALAAVGPLASLSISDLHFGPPEVEILNSFLPQSRSLLSVTLAGCTRTTAALSSLIFSLRSVPTLRSLSLERAKLGAMGGTVLAESLRNWPDLARLRLRRIGFKEECARELAKELAKGAAGRIEDLDLGENKLGDRGIALIVDGMIAGCTIKGASKGRLRVLDLFYCRFSAGGGERVAELVRWNPGLESINICYCQIGDGPFGKSLRTCAHSLRTLSACGCGFTPVSIASICTALLDSRTLASLCLSSNDFGLQGTDAVGLLLRKATALANLDISTSNAIIEKSFTMGLATCHSLRSLRVNANYSIGYGNASMLFDSLPGSVEEADFSSCNIQDSAMSAIQRWLLRGKKSIRKLTLSYNKFTPRGLRQIAEALGPRLEELGVQCNNEYLDEDDAKTVADLVIRERLRVFMVGNLRMGAAAVDAILRVVVENVKENGELREVHIYSERSEGVRRAVAEAQAAVGSVVKIWS